MALPTIEEILCLYLYGDTQKPSDLVDEALIRGSQGATKEVDIYEYMTVGAGRFVGVDNFD